MRLEQHIYTSGKPEFTTVAVTEGVSHEERIHLENHSLYILPGSLLYQDDLEPPVKYVYYPLGKDRFVVGRAVYTGKDTLGRPGNYFFHNFVGSQNELLFLFHLNPVELIRYLEKEHLFKKTVPDGALPVVQISPEQIELPSSASAKIPADALMPLLYVCLQHELLQVPLLLNGSEQECLEFLTGLYPLLPYHVRAALSFDTYTYGADLDFDVLGLPEKPELRQHVSASFTVHLKSGQYTALLEVPTPSKQLSLMATMIAAGQEEDLNRIYSLEYKLRMKDFASFAVHYSKVFRKIQDIVLDFHKKTLLQHIVDAQDCQLLHLIQAQMAVEDFTILAASPEMVRQLLETEDARIARLFAEWLCLGDEQARDCYPFLFRYPLLWQAFLEYISEQPQHITALLAPLRLFPEYYISSYERPLLSVMFSLLPILAEEKKLGKAFCEIFGKLPQSESEELTLLRTAVRYELGKNDDLLTSLLKSDPFTLSDVHQHHVLNILLKGIFRIKKSEEMQQQLYHLFEKSLREQKTLLAFLHSLEQIERSKKVRALLKEMFQEIPEKAMTAEVTSRIQRLLKPPLSFFRKITHKILENF